MIAVLRGSYSAYLYAEIPGDHLSVVFKGRPGLKMLWMKGSCEKLSEYISGEVAEDSIPLEVDPMRGKHCPSGRCQE